MTNNTSHNYFIFSLTKTIEEEAHMNTLDLANKTPEECLKELKRFRKARRRQERERTRPRTVPLTSSMMVVTGPLDQLEKPTVLSEQEWRIVLMRVEGLTFDEIASVTGAHEKAARVIMKRIADLINPENILK